nr:Chain C, Nucleocapsid protein [Influenza A virus (A/swine/Minnesota/A01327763/2012(H3N2))]
TIAMELIRMIK